MTTNANDFGLALGDELGAPDLSAELDQALTALGRPLTPAAPAAAPAADGAVVPATAAATDGAVSPAAAPAADGPVAPSPEEFQRVQAEADRWRQTARQQENYARDATRGQQTQQLLTNYRAQLEQRGFSPEASEGILADVKSLVTTDQSYMQGFQQKQAVVFELARTHKLGVDVMEDLMAATPQAFNEILNKNITIETPREREMNTQLTAMQKEIAELKKGQAPPAEFGGIGGAGVQGEESAASMMKRIGTEPGYLDRLSEEQKLGILALAQ